MDDTEYDLYDDDTDQDEEEDDDDEFVDMQLDPETSNATERQDLNDDFQYTVLTPDQLVKFMVDSIQEVNVVVQVCCSLITNI